jgi:hypothetical protein
VLLLALLLATVFVVGCAGTSTSYRAGRPANFACLGERPFEDPTIAHAPTKF